MFIRDGRESDLDPLTRIYNHYVTTTHTTFDLQPFETSGRKPWFDQFGTDGRVRLLVLEVDGGAAGYACSTPFKQKPAYRVSVETSVYLDPDHVGKGAGSLLLSTLLDTLREESVHGAYAGIALPNEASERLHEKLGYRRIGVLTEVGRKFDRFWDVAWYEKRLGGEPE